MDAEISGQHFYSRPSTHSLFFLSSLSFGLIPVSIQRLLRLPNGDESWWCVRDLTTLRHKSGKLVHQHQPWMNWVNGILMLQIVGESVVWSPEIPLWLCALCPETCCSRFIHLYPLQVGSWLPESQQNTDSHLHTRKGTCQGLYWCPVQWLSFLETCTLKSWAHYPAIKLSYLACAHRCQERFNFSLMDSLFPSKQLHDVLLQLQQAGRSALLRCMNCLWLEEQLLSGAPWSHGAWQKSLNPSSWGWVQSGVLNWHLQQAWRLAPVSRSICCTAIRLHLCTRRTCVSWITFKLIWGLRWSDSRPNGAWRKP